MPSERRAAEKLVPETTMGEAIPVRFVMFVSWRTVMLTIPVWVEMVLVTRMGTTP